MGEFDSRELLWRYRLGQSKAAQEIFDRYVERLIGLARTKIAPKMRRRIDPEDVVQSTYRSFFRRANDGDFVLQRAGDLWRLLAAITLNKLYGQVERHTAQMRSVDQERPNMSEVEISRHAAVRCEPTPAEAAELLEQVQIAVAGLHPDVRSALIARLQGQTIEEISTSMRRSQRTVRRLLLQARKHVETLMASP